MVIKLLAIISVLGLFFAPGIVATGPVLTLIFVTWILAR